MVHIRELQKNDIPELAKLAAKTFTETFGHSFTPEEDRANSRACTKSYGKLT
jgi:hypothetical protein